MKRFISVREALDIVLSSVRATPVEHLPLAASLGRTLAEDVRSRDDIPPFANSAMDGYAVRLADLATLPATLPILEDIPAGTIPTKPLTGGACSRIMTGAPVPASADAVVPVEWTRAAGGGAVRFLRAPQAGQYVRPQGEDVRAGDTVIRTGTVVTPPVLGMMASVGCARVRVARKPVVSVVSTGDELVDIAAELSPGMIRDSNGPALAAQVALAGGSVRGPFRARDEPANVRAVVSHAAEADVMLLSGGVSVGTHDCVKRVLDDMGMRLLFWKVRQRPGKPLAFGILGDCLVFGLPGNPVSSAICFDRYVRPALARMAGRADVRQKPLMATLERATPKTAGLHTFARGIARHDDSGRLVVRDTGPQASNLYSSMAEANCLIHLAEELDQAPAGLKVEIEWLTW